MDNKTKRLFSLVLMTTMSLSILAIAAPAMAENITDGERICGTPVYGEEEHLKCNVTGLEIESSSATLESMPLLPAITAFTPDTTIDISEESAQIGNFTDMSAVSSPDCRCDIRWFGQGVWSSKTGYYVDNEILCYVQFINYYHEDTYDCSYSLEGKLYDLSGGRVEYCSVSGAIKKGDMQTQKCRFPAPATGWGSGRYEFCCRIKPMFCDAIEKSCIFDVRPPNPDLVITSLWSDNSTIYYKIKNKGHKTAGASNTSLTVDGVFMTSDSVSSLGSGATVTGSFNYTWNCTNTNDTIEVCADYTDEVYEYSDSNNCRAKTWTCPDLTITDVWFVNNTMICYKIMNNGDKTACASSTSLTVDGVFTASDSVASLEHGVERTGIFNYTWICTNPSDTISVCADYTDNVTEGNESNNSRTVTWTCPPDIWISPNLFDITQDSDVVSDHTLTIGNNWIGTLEFGVHDVADSHATSQSGWPKMTDGSVHSSPALGDIDGDGDLEVVVGSGLFNDKKVYAWHHDGSIVNGWPKTTGGDVRSSPALGDIDGDGDMEVVVGSWDYKVYAWHHDGSAVAGWPKTTGSAVDSSPSLGDIDGDGDIEVVVGSYDKKVYAWHHDGSAVTGWPKTTGSSVQSSPALGDIDGDGDIEVVVGSCDNKVYAWHHDGSTVSGWPKRTGDDVSSSPALGDIDGDGDIEVVVGSDDDKVYAWHHDGSAVAGWPKTTGGGVESSPSLGDIDGDEDIEVVVGSDDDKVYVWHHDGSAVAGWPKTTGGGVESSPSLGDIDGDGDIEVVVGSRDNKVYAWHHDGSTVSGWPKTTGGAVRSSPALGDIDGDGDIEIVIGSSDNKVYVWDCSGIYNPSSIEWGTFRHDVRRSGLYKTTSSRGEAWLSEYPTIGTVVSGSQTNITVTVNTSGLPFGKCAANIIITSNDPDENPVIIPVRLTILQPPDLVITDVWNENSTIYYKIKNKGDKTSGASSTSLTVDGVFITSDSIASLEPGVEGTESFDYTLNCTNPSDSNTVEICADCTDDITESSETNNCRTEILSACPPDSFWVRPDSFDVTLSPDVVLNYTLTIGNNWIGTLEFNLSNIVDPQSGVSSQIGWPKKISNDDVSFSSPALGDIDGDGDIEIVVGSHGRVYAWHHNGSIVSGWPGSAGVGAGSSPALGDIDGDGDIEIVVGGSSGNTVYAWHHDGSAVAGWPKTTGGSVPSSPALDDIDGDGDIEIVIGSRDDKVYAWHHDGSTVSGWPKTTGDDVSSSPALGDIDGDGDIEIVIGSVDKNVYAWHHDGSTVTGWPKTTGSYVSFSSSPVLGDIDGDGDIEVVVGSGDGRVYVWHHNGSAVAGWPKTTGKYSSSPVLGDIDGDGDIEIVAGSYNGKLYAWHHDGSAVRGWPHSTGNRASPVLGDIDGDGDIEIMAGSVDKKVYAWHHDGSAVAGWPKTTYSYVSSSPALGDIDGDGDIEVVVGSDKMYVWDCSGIYNPNNIEWGMFRHDVRHTGLYKAMTQASWLSESPTSGTVHPDSQTSITVTFNTSGLPFGNYTANIAINDLGNNPVIIPVRLTVTTSQKGDLNSDGKITPADAAIALQIAAGSRPYAEAADVNCDRTVTSLDALVILQAAA